MPPRTDAPQVHGRRLQRKREGKKTQTGMSENELEKIRQNESKKKS